MQISSPIAFRTMTADNLLDSVSAQDRRRYSLHGLSSLSKDSILSKTSPGSGALTSSRMSDVFSSKRERKPSEMAICIIDCQYLLPKRASLQFNPYAVVFLSGHVGDIHVVSGWGQIFELLAGEDVDGDDVDLGVTVLSSLGGRHVNDLAWSALDDDVSVLSESRTLHRVGLRGAGIGSVDGEVCLYITSCQ